MKQALIISGVVLLAVFVFFEPGTVHSQFYRDEIDGKIEAINKSGDQVVILIDSFQYKLNPVALNNLPPFFKIAQIGDDIRKKANDDNFILVHQEDELFEYKGE